MPEPLQPTPSLETQPRCTVSFLLPGPCRPRRHRTDVRLTARSRLRLCGISASCLLVSRQCRPCPTRRATVQPAAVATADPIAGFVAEASQRFAIPASWIRAVMQAESGGDVRAMSPKGAMGLMQIMPETWAELRRATASVPIPMIRTTTSLRGGLSARAARSLRRAWLPRSLQCRSQSLRRSSRDRPTAAGGDARPTWPRSPRCSMERLAGRLARCCIMGIEFAVRSDSERWPRSSPAIAEASISDRRSTNVLPSDDQRPLTPLVRRTVCSHIRSESTAMTP